MGIARLTAARTLVFENLETSGIAANGSDTTGWPVRTAGVNVVPALVLEPTTRVLPVPVLMLPPAMVRFESTSTSQFWVVIDVPAAVIPEPAPDASVSKHGPATVDMEFVLFACTLTVSMPDVVKPLAEASMQALLN